MKKLITVFVKYPFYAKLIVSFLIVAGLLSFTNMKKSFFPERTSTDITVSVIYPGASPKEVEEGITSKIEAAVRGIVGIKEINSTSSEDISIVRITTTGKYPLDDTLMEVKNAVDSISSMPVLSEKPVVSKQRTVTQAMYLGLSGEVDLITLKKYANKIEDDLLTSGIVSQVLIKGFPPLEISIEVNEDTLLRYSLTIDEITRTIASNNRDISAGMIKSEKEEILIRARNRSIEPDKIGSIILRAKPGSGYLRVRDVAKIKTQFAEISSLQLMNGKRSISIMVNKLSEEDLEKISKYMNDYVEKFNNKNKGVQLHITYDFLPMLNSRLNLLYKNGGVGLLLVVISLGLFLSFRLAMWVAWGIPAAFLAMFIVAVFSGITINMISLFGMILVIGILVDDGIVIAENIYSHFEGGKSPKRSAIDGTMEVLPAVITSVTTTIVAFSPLFLLTGKMEFMYEMAFVVVFSLLFSLFEAFLVLPAHIGTTHVLRIKNREGKGIRIRKFLDNILKVMRDKIYANILKRIIKFKWIFVTIPLAIIMITAGLIMGQFVKLTFFPNVNFDMFNINIAFKPGEGETRTMKYLKRFDKAVWEVNDELVKKYGMNDSLVNYTFLTLGTGFDGKENGSHTGNINVLLKNLDDVKNDQGKRISSYEIAAMVRKKIGPIKEAEKFTTGGNNRFGKPVSISILGDNLKELEEAKKLLMEELKKIPTIINLSSSDAKGKREIKIELKPKAYYLGLNRTIIANQIRQGFFGDLVQRLQLNKDELKVWVRYPKKNRETVGQLDEMRIKTKVGEFPLKEIVDYKIDRGPVVITRYNGIREINIEGDLDNPDRSVPPILNYIRKKILPKISDKYPEIKFMFKGQQKESKETIGDVKKFFGIALFIIIIILMIHFKSFSQPIIILMMIPMAWVGAAWGHGFEGMPISMLSAWGMVALSGVIINDAVVFLAKYNSNLVNGMKIKEAVFDAGISRFRAIILTTVTTVLGLYPIVLETSFQAQFLKPMAITLAYGVTIGTFFILMFFPALILVLNDLKVFKKRILTGKKPEPETVENAVIDSKINIDED